MAFWLLKSEPDAFSWAQMWADGTTRWDGVRNHQAAGHLRRMQPGEHAFFYHSNTGQAVVGVVRVIRPYYPDPTDPSGRFVAVDVAAVAPVPHPVPLKSIKADPRLSGMALVRQSRLSVCPLTDDEWQYLCTLSGYNTNGPKD